MKFLLVSILFLFFYGCSSNNYKGECKLYDANLNLSNLKQELLYICEPPYFKKSKCTTKQGVEGQIYYLSDSKYSNYDIESIRSSYRDICRQICLTKMDFIEQNFRHIIHNEESPNLCTNLMK